MSSNTTIHVGFWSNWAKGPVTGSTLTLRSRDGAILIAALAIFIQLVGGQSWNIICFMVHQLRISANAKNGFHHQLQATLRNNTSDVRTFWQLTNIWWYWRGLSAGSFRKSVQLVLICAFHFFAFATVGIASSYITTVGNQVLIATTSGCGPWKQAKSWVTEGTSISQSDVAYSSYQLSSIQASRQYVQGCVRDSESLPECDHFQRLQLNWTSTKIPCPFQDMCLGPVNSSIIMDTNLLDSRDDFGINGRDEDRIKFKRTATCSPITTQGYTKSGTTLVNYQVFNANSSFGQIPVNYTAAFYGNGGVSLSHMGVDDLSLENLTYLYTNYRDAATIFYNYNSLPYDIIIETADVGWGFEPIPALSVPNTTMSLIFASFYGEYTEPSDDLWLSAHQPMTRQLYVDDDTEVTVTYYGPDQPFSVLACVEQFQFCNPASTSNSTSRCTTPASGTQISDYATNQDSFRRVFDNEHQVATALAFGIALDAASINSVVVRAPPVPILAASLITAQDSLPPAPSQWILETENWFQIGLAAMQRLTVEYISGPPAQYAEYVVEDEKNHDAGLKWLCGNQKIRRNDYTNFSTLAISIIFGMGLLIIGVSLYLETFVGYVRQRWRKGRWKQRAWWAEGTLQLQRRAFEGMGVRDWEFGEWDRVPVTRKGKVWSALGNWDEMLRVKGQKELVFPKPDELLDLESSVAVSTVKDEKCLHAF